jgi:hypothetical protein
MEDSGQSGPEWRTRDQSGRDWHSVQIEAEAEAVTAF